MSSSSLIFSMGAIFMKVNSTFVFTHYSHFIGYTLVHSYLAITLALGCFELGLLSWPSHLLSKVSSPVVMGGSHPPSGMTLVALRLSTIMWTMEEITVTNHIERESCDTLIAILYLNFYVRSFYAFLLDSSIYTNFFLVSSPFIGGHLLS